MIYLYTNWYIAKDAERREENRTCLEINLSNPLIDGIILMCDETVKEFDIPKHRKITAVKLGCRPTYRDYFKEMNECPNHTRIISNTDIYFDDTLNYVEQMTEKQVFALTRWEDLPEGKLFLGSAGSQDVWIFKGIIKDADADFPIGYWGCDNKLAYELDKVGYKVQNPSKTIKTYHLHRGERDMTETYDTVTDKVLPPYKYLYSCKLTEIDQPHLAIGIPCNHTHVPAPFFDSFIQMERPDFIYIPAKNGPVDEMRNYIVARAIQSGCTHLLMMDTDQIYPKNTIEALFSNNVDVCHARVYRRYPPFDALMFELLDKGRYIERTDYDEGDIVEVDACGTGCVLYDIKVFETIKAPWFEFVRDADGDRVGEDVNFCKKLKEKGYKIWVDTSVNVKHLGVIEIDEAFSFLHKKLRENQQRRNAELSVKRV